MSNRRALFETLHNDYHSMVSQMCKGFVKGQEDLAKDLTQETFIYVWKALEKFRGQSSHKTWIYRITVNTCLKFIRDQKLSQSNQIDQLPELQAEEVQSYSELYNAIGQLTEIDRLIIMMVLDELPYSEISEVMGLSEGNLRVKIHRIKKNLKNILENEWHARQL